jgi:hypothetical protein
MVVAVPALAYEQAKSPGARIWLLSAVSGNRKSADRGISGASLIAPTEYCERALLFTPADLWNRRTIKRLRRDIAEFSPDRTVLLTYTGDKPLGVAKKLLLLAALGMRVRPEGWRLQNTFRFFTRVQYEMGALHHKRWPA